MYQLSIVTGILVAFLSNYVLNHSGPQRWSWMLGVGAFPAAVYVIMILLVPESPRWLVMKGKLEAARAVLRKVDPRLDFQQYVASLGPVEK